MPKERVVEPAVTAHPRGWIEVEGQSEKFIEQPAIDISWGYRGVEINVDAPVDVWKFLYQESDIYDPPITKWSTKLSRQQINNIIQILRRARNAQFGQDE